MTEPAANNRIWIVLVALLMTIALAQSFTEVATWGEWPPDFEAYWSAGSRLRLGGLIYENPDGPVLHDIKAYIYPPVFAALFAPLTWFPKSVCASIWAALHALFAAVLFWNVLQLSGRKGSGWQLAAMLATVLILPLTQEMREGQVNLPVLMMFAIGLLELKEGRDKRAGVWLALSAHCKILPIVVLPLLLLSGRKQAAKWMLIWLLLLAPLPLIWTVANRGPIDGVQDLVFNYMDWLEIVVFKALSTSNPAGLEQFYAFNNSGHALMHRWFDDVSIVPGIDVTVRGPLLFQLPLPLLSVVGTAVPLLMCAATCLAAWKRKHAGLTIVLGFMAAQFLNLLFWDHHMLSLALLAGALLSSGVSWKRGWMVFAPFIALVTVPYVVWYLLQTTSWEWPLHFLHYGHAWGLPTFAFLAAWGFAFVYVWKHTGKTAEEPTSTAEA